MKISEELFQKGISFRKGEEFLPFPVDDAQPTLPGSKYYLDKAVLGQIRKAWLQLIWFVSFMMVNDRRQEFVSQFFPGNEFSNKSSAPETAGWGTRQRSEIDWYKSGLQDYFAGPHVTRIDFGLTSDNKLVIIDPNVMHYGITPMVATQEVL